MLVAKQVADLITWGRVGIALLLPWLGWTYGPAALPLAVWLMLLDWTGDSVDGTLARRSRHRYRTWIGDHDLEVDIAVSLGLLFYLTAAGWVTWKVTTLYLILWAFIFWTFGYRRVLGELIQAPIYGHFTLTALREAPTVGWLLPAWMATAIVLTWPRFPEEKVKGFLQGMAQLFGRGEDL